MSWADAGAWPGLAASRRMRAYGNDRTAPRLGRDGRPWPRRRPPLASPAAARAAAAGLAGLRSVALAEPMAGPAWRRARGAGRLGMAAARRLDGPARRGDRRR